MSSNLQQREDIWPEDSGIYERAFMSTVLHLHGILGSPSPLQMAKARKVLRLYMARVAVAGIRLPAADIDTLRGRLSQSAGTEHAFMLVRFDSVLPPDARQVLEFNEWLEVEYSQSQLK